MIKLFGSLEIRDNGRLSPLMKSSKGCALLTYLLITNQSQTRAHIADLFWGDTNTATALRNLRQLLYQMRRYAPEIVVTRQTVVLELAPATQVDYSAVRAALDQDDIAQLDPGLQQATGDLLATFYIEDAPYFNEWLTLARERIRAEIMDAYHRLCTAYEAAQAWDAGISAARRWLTLDDFHEPTHRWLMRFLATNGQVAAARQQYDNCCQRLWEELGVEPEAATQRLANQLEKLAGEEEVVVTAVSQWQPDPLPQPDTLPAPGLLPPHTILPYQRNQDFVGRETDLLQLGEWLLPWQEAQESGRSRESLRQSPITAAITGMGGLGKTQLAVEFAYRYGRFYAGGVYWISFAQAENVAEEIAALGGERGMRLYTEAEKLTAADQVGRVQRAWQAPTPRLLIFDNCEDEALFAKWRPVSGGCHILLTSRHGEWTRDLAVLVNPLSTLARSESVKLLQQMTSHLPQTECRVLDQIAATLGDLPLAIHLAGSFLHRYQRITPTRYLVQLEQLGPLQHPSLQGRGKGYSPTAHERNVARTFAYSLEQLDPDDEIDALARHLLVRAAYFAPNEPIPSALLIATLQQAEAGEPDLLAELLAEDGLARLLSLGFLRQAEQATVVMHRLLVGFTQTSLSVEEEAKTAVCQTVVTLCNQSLQKTRVLNELPVALGHIRHLIHTAGEKADDLTVELCYFLGAYYTHAADFAMSQKYYEQALELSQKIFGHNHPQTAKYLDGLATFHLRAGTYWQAWRLYKEVLTAYEMPQHPHHSKLVSLLNNMGYLLTLQGRYQQAQICLQRLMAILKQENKLDTVMAALCWNNLGVVLLHLGDDETSQGYLEKGLHIRERLLGVDHAHTAVSLQNIGLFHLKHQVYEKAQDYLERALAVRQKVVGHNHHHTARSLNALGELFLAQADYEMARANFEQALAILADVLTTQHPEKGKPLKNLGEVYWAVGQREQARPFFEQARDIWEATAAASHPDLRFVQQRLATFAEKKPYYSSE